MTMLLYLSGQRQPACRKIQRAGRLQYAYEAIGFFNSASVPDVTVRHPRDKG